MIFCCVFLPVTKGRLGGRGYLKSSLFPLCQKPAGATVQSRSKMDSEQVFLFSKTCNLGKTPRLSLVSHLSLQKHVCLPNFVDHFYIAFNFCYFFKPGIISNLLFDFQVARCFLDSLLFCCHFFIPLHYTESVKSYGFCLFGNYSIVGCSNLCIEHHIAFNIYYLLFIVLILFFQIYLPHVGISDSLVFYCCLRFYL